MSYIAWNTVTGAYWNGTAFEAKTADEAATLDAAQLVVLRYTYNNVDSLAAPSSTAPSEEWCYSTAVSNALAAVDQYDSIEFEDSVVSFRRNLIDTLRGSATEEQILRAIETYDAFTSSALL